MKHLSALPRTFVVMTAIAIPAVSFAQQAGAPGQRGATDPIETIPPHACPGFVIERNIAYPMIPGTGLPDYTERGTQMTSSMICPSSTSARSNSRGGGQRQNDNAPPPFPATGAPQQPLDTRIDMRR